MIESYLVCKKINQAERQRLALIFESIDEDKSGIIDIEEFKKFYCENSEHYDVKEVEELLNIIDKNRSGKIDFNEFISAMYSRRKLFQLKSLEEAFDFFDKDRSGALSKEELRSILEGIQNEEVEYLFKQLDSNNDDHISKKEFINYLFDHQSEGHESAQAEA